MQQQQQEHSRSYEISFEAGCDKAAEIPGLAKDTVVRNAYKYFRQAALRL
jgi:hypothetical protein